MAIQITRGEADAPIEPLTGRTVAVIGFGNQGRAHALNLRDSGIAVIIGARPDGTGAAAATEAGFDVVAIERAAGQADLAVIALPDEAHENVYRQQIGPFLKSGVSVGFLHGLSIHSGLVKPARGIGVVLVAPKGPGAALRDRFVRGQGLPCLMAVHEDSAAGEARALGLAWAAGIGCARAGIIHTTFAAEAETDLFGEQAVLCGGATWLMLAAFETLVEAGYPPELAYLECCHEMKQVVDLVYERGISGMCQAISNTAEFGAHHAGPAIVGDEVRQAMRRLLEEIRSGQFATSLREDHAAGFQWFQKQREILRQHPIERAGEAVRGLMPWLGGCEP